MNKNAETFSAVAKQCGEAIVELWAGLLTPRAKAFIGSDAQRAHRRLCTVDFPRRVFEAMAAEPDADLARCDAIFAKIMGEIETESKALLLGRAALAIALMESRGR